MTAEASVPTWAPKPPPLGPPATAHAPTAVAQQQQQRPAYVKIIIGGLLTTVEGLAGGHAIEQAKIVKQATGLSYPGAVRHAYQAGGLQAVFLRGFYPFGLLQAWSKGVPILFCQGEAARLAQAMAPQLDRKQAMAIGGFVAGGIQGVCVTPTQRMKTLAMTDTAARGPVGLGYAVRLAQAEGVASLCRGTAAMSLRRASDWAIRFYGLAHVRAMLERWSGGKRFWHPLVAGFAGGALSIATLPLDTVVAQSQRAGSRGGPAEVARTLYQQAGLRAFFRGAAARVIHSGYHTMIVGGGGVILYDLWQSFQESKE